MYFTKKFIKVFTALHLTTNYCLASPFHHAHENENEADGLSSLSGSTAMHLRRSDLTVPVGKKEKNMKENLRRILNKATTSNIFSRAHKDDDCCSSCCCCENDDDDNSLLPPTTSPTTLTIANPSTKPTANPSTKPTPNPSTKPTPNPSYSEKKLVVSDGDGEKRFGCSCSLTDDLVVIGAYSENNNEGAAYLFRLDGTEVRKLEKVTDGVIIGDMYGISVSIDEKVVAGADLGHYVEVFSRDGIYERTLTCDTCIEFAKGVATHGDIIVSFGQDMQGTQEKVFIYSTDGEKLKEFGHGSNTIHDVAISEQFIVSTSLWGNALVYSNVAPDFPLFTEIEQKGGKIAITGDKVVIGNAKTNSAWLYDTKGVLIKELVPGTSTLAFGWSVAITELYVLVGAKSSDDQGEYSGSAFIYSSINGDLIETILSPDGEAGDFFGSSVCASDSYYMVGADGEDSYTGGAYLFNLPF